MLFFGLCGQRQQYAGTKCRNVEFTVLVNNQLDAQFLFLYMFISILYMFQAAICSSSGESIVWNMDGTAVPSKPTYGTVTHLE